MGQARRPRDRSRAALLRLEPRLLGEQAHHLVAGRALLLAHVGPGQFDQYLVGGNLLPFLDAQRRHDPAVAMLDGLALADDRHLSWRVSGGIERCERRPPQEQDEEDEGDDQPEADVALGAVERRDVRHRQRAPRHQLHLVHAAAPLDCDPAGRGPPAPVLRALIVVGTVP